jgi:hypothetical protein
MSEQSQTSKKKLEEPKVAISTRTLNLLAIIIFVILGSLGIASLSKDRDNELQETSQTEKTAQMNAEEEKIALWRRDGATLDGISPVEIEKEFKKQKALSSAKGSIYLDSLEGRSVVYAGQVDTVKENFIGDGYYISIDVNDIDVFIDDPGGEYVETVVEGDLIKVSGRIRDIASDFLGFSIYIEGAVIEVIEKNIPS